MNTAPKVLILGLLVAVSCTEEISVEKIVTVHDTVFVKAPTVVKTDTIYLQRTDTVYQDSIVILETRLTILHPEVDPVGEFSYSGIIEEWITRAQAAGFKLPAATVIITFPHVGDSDGMDPVQTFTDLKDGKHYIRCMPWNVPIWRGLSNALLGKDYIYWPDDAGLPPTVTGVVPPEYDYLMFQALPFYWYDNSSEQRKEQYWDDMLL